MSDWLEEIEGISNTRYIKLDDGTFFNCHIDRLIAEVKRLREENAELCKQLELEHDQRDRLPINIIFDAPPSHDSGRFVEVETDDGQSIRVGEWIEKDGYWALRITELPKASAQK